MIDQPYSEFEETDTVYEGPIVRDLAWNLNMYKVNLDKWGRRLARKLKKNKLVDLFPNVQDRAKQLESIGTEDEGLSD